MSAPRDLPGRRPEGDGPRAARGRRIPRRILLASFVALLVAVLAWAASQWRRRAEETAVTVPAAADTAGTGFRSARLWLVSRSGDSLVSETRDLIEQVSLHDQVATLVDELVRAQAPAGADGGISPLPPGTTVQAVYLDERGLLTLDLSPAFRAGFRGGAGAEELALAALVRTLADNLPQVTRVQFVCGGTAIASLNGHVPLDRPLDVDAWP